MPAKTLFSALFLISIVVAAWVVIHALPQNSDAATEPGSGGEILVAAAPLEAGTLLRATDVTWQVTPRAPAPGEFVRPSAAAREVNPEIDEQARAQVYGAVLRTDVAAGEPIHRHSVVKPLEREFLQSVLAPGARAIAIPVATGGASTDLLSPGDRVDVILTQKFGNTGAPLTRSSVAETVVENLRVLVVGAIDPKAAAGNTFGRTVTLEVMPDQAEKIQVAAELGKLSLTLRSSSGAAGASTPGPGKATGVKPTWAGDVSPALGGAMPAEKVLQAERPPVDIIRGAGQVQSVKQQ
jgi:pilus assembly protein CpaB